MSQVRILDPQLSPSGPETPTGRHEAPSDSGGTGRNPETRDDGDSATLQHAPRGSGVDPRATTGATSAPLPGVYRGVREAVYHSWPYASASRLNLLAEKSPAHVRWEMDHPSDPTPDMVIGSACHSVILTPGRFNCDYITARPCSAILKSGDRKGMACGKSGAFPVAEGLWYCGTHFDGADDGVLDGLTVLSPDDAKVVERCHEAVTTHPLAGRLIDGAADTELSIVWDCPDTGLRLKARIDAFLDGVLVDLKSTACASSRAFTGSMLKWGYHRQIALYLEALAAHGMKVDIATIIAFEKTPPFAVAVYRIDPADIPVGHSQNRRLKALFRQCEASGQWPGYGDSSTTISLPDWYRQRDEF